MSIKPKLTIPWDQIEEGAQEQIDAVLDMDCLKALAIMPDVHKGYDLPIGAVALLRGHVWPGAVGYDIGCGMCHVNIGAAPWVSDRAEEVFERISRVVPVGTATRDRPTMAAPHFKSASKVACLTDAVRERASMQLGTLGGGNHFIEVGVNDKGEVGITIHSGSRRPGWLIGDFYMRMTGGPIPLVSEWGSAYLRDMKWALSFALENRSAMMKKCLQVLGVGRDCMMNMINENHNHATVTRAGVLHRKGATPAAKGQLGIIPANMRDGVYITRGLGNKEFLESASHGAGRAMGRKAAERELDADVFKKQMHGVVTGDLGGMLDEAPGAYKDIQGVLAAQEGITVEVVDHFKPLVVVKG